MWKFQNKRPIWHLFCLFLFLFSDGTGFADVNQIAFRSPLHLTTEAGDQMQIYAIQGGNLVYLFLRERPEPLITNTVSFENESVREIHLSDWEPLYQAFPVWQERKVEISEEDPNAVLDLSEIAIGKAVLEFSDRTWNFERAAEPRIFEIGHTADEETLPTQASFPVLFGDAFSDLPIDVDLANHLADEAAILNHRYRLYLRSPSRPREHSFVVYPIEILPESVSFLAVTRVYANLAGNHDISAFSYRKTKNGWKRVVWEKEIANDPEWAKVFAENRYSLAWAIGDETYTVDDEISRSSFVAVPVGDRMFVKFKTYMIGGGVSLMPEMFIPKKEE